MVGTTSRVPRTRWGYAALYGGVGALIVAIVVLGFVWPTATAHPAHLPVAVSGPAEAVDQLTASLASEDPAPFAVENVNSRDEAIEMMERREVYGAILLGPQPEVLVASGAGTAPAQALRGVAAVLQSQIWNGAQAALTEQFAQIGAAVQQGQLPSLPAAAPTVPSVVVTDIVPLAPGDSTGAGIAAAAFPLVLGGIAGGVLLVLLVSGIVRRLVGLAVFAVLGGAGIAFVLQTWLGLVPGPWVLLAAASGLSIAATGALIIGLNALLGSPGIAVGAVITMLVGNPIAAVSVPWEFLPAPWGQIGQGFVPGASAALVRSIAYFPAASELWPWLTLSMWTIAGTAVALVGHYRERADITPASAQLED